MKKYKSAREDLRCKIYPLGALTDYIFVVVCSRYEDKWLLSRHKNRDTFETQDGHIENGETPLDAAYRELYEESGVRDATLYPVCDYHGYDNNASSNGVLFFADIHSLGKLPDSEMKETRLFDELPENLTYPNVTPKLFAESEKVLRKQKHLI